MISMMNATVVQPASPDVIALVAGFVTLMSDKEATQAAISEYKASTEQLTAATEALRAAQAQFAAAEQEHRDKLAALDAQHEATMRQREQEFDARTATQTNALLAREQRASDLSAKAQADAEAAAALKADLERRLGLLRSAAAA